MSIDAIVTGVQFLQKQDCQDCNNTGYDQDSITDWCNSCLGTALFNVALVQLCARDDSPAGQSTLRLNHATNEANTAIASWLGRELWGNSSQLFIGDTQIASRNGYASVCDVRPAPNKEQESKMNVDLTTLTPGDKVRLRNGDVLKWDGAMNENEWAESHPWIIEDFTYTSEGRYDAHGHDHNFDVVEIISKDNESKMNVDLTTLKTGDKVLTRRGEVIEWEGEWSTGKYKESHPWFIGGRSYTQTGRWSLNPNCEDGYDIVEILLNEHSRIVSLIDYLVSRVRAYDDWFDNGPYTNAAYIAGEQTAAIRSTIRELKDALKRGDV